MRATKLTACIAASIFAVTPAALIHAGADAAPASKPTVSKVVVKSATGQARELEITRSAPFRELEIIRQNRRLGTMTLRTDNARELEIVRGMRELEIVRVNRVP